MKISEVVSRRKASSEERELKVGESTCANVKFPEASDNLNSDSVDVEVGGDGKRVVSGPNSARKIPAPEPPSSAPKVKGRT